MRNGSTPGFLAWLLIPPASVFAHIFVTDSAFNKITEYNFDGTTANPSLVTGLSAPLGICISGTNIFVQTDSKVALYTTVGSTQNASLVTGLSGPQNIAVSGNTLFVSTQSSTRIAQYTLSGATATLDNASLVSGFSYITGITISGSSLFVLDGGTFDTDGSGKVAMYALSGTTATPVNTSLITGLNIPTSMAMYGSDLFITCFYEGGSDTGSVRKYTVSGSTAIGGTLIGGSLVSFPNAIAVTDDGATLFVYNSGTGATNGGSIGEFTTAGATVNASLIPGLTPFIGGMALSSNTAPTFSITQWRSVRNHVLDVPQRSMVLNPSATGNGSLGPTVERRDGGIQRIEVDFSNQVTIADASAVTVGGRTTSYPGGVLGSPVSYTPASVSMSAASTMAMVFNPGALPDQTCYTIMVPAAAISQTLTGDTDVMVRTLAGDVTGSADLKLSDALASKAKIGQPMPQNFPFDLNLDGQLTNADALYAKARISSPARQALCP